jgi:hypothetical protein
MWSPKGPFIEARGYHEQTDSVREEAAGSYEQFGRISTNAVISVYFNLCVGQSTNERNVRCSFVLRGRGRGGDGVLFMNWNELSLNKMWLISKQTHLLVWRHNKYMYL